ncbi:MAG: inositol monophosphatase family protein [Oscillospiraceae bacterium]|jgi:myo-inositol-1(or 4)-monophosphatase
MQNALLKANQEAGKHLLAPHSLQINHKADLFDLVTDMDLRVQELLRSAYARILPEAAFLGEEDMSDTPAPGQLYWLVDPIDGTKNFVHNLMQSCLATALCKDGEALLACVYNPWNGEFYFAQQGKGATLNGEPIQVSNRSFQDSMVATGQGYGARKETVKRLGPLWEHCYIHCRGIRAFGSAELTLCYVAAGRLDGYLEQALMPWDYIPGNLIIREAGGVATNWKGELPSPTGMDSLLVGTQAFHQVMLPLCQDL